MKHAKTTTFHYIGEQKELRLLVVTSGDNDKNDEIKCVIKPSENLSESFLLCIKS